jgi:hypothetical protein
MAYGKSNKSGSMNSPVGMCSTKSNPMKKSRQVSSECGPGMNADQKKANGLLQKAYKQQDSLRGMSGM